MKTLTLCAVGVALLTSLAVAAEKPRYRIAYATYIGGKEWDEAREVIVGADGSMLIGMQSNNPGMPLGPGAFQEKYAGDEPNLGHGGVYGGDCYLLRLGADGRKVLAGTYFGGSKQERNVYGLGIDSKGNVVIATMTRSPDAPTTEGCFQKRFAGGASDMLVAKFSPDLRKVLWCTYIGGSGDDSPRGGLMVDEQDCVYVVGTTNSPNFPTTAGAHQRKLNGPRDSAIVKLNPDGAQVFSTLLGGSGEDDAIMGIRRDAEGNLYVAGHTKSGDFPVTDGAAQAKTGGQSDCYVAKLSPDASRLIYATYLGGSGNEFAEHRPFLAADGSLIVSGFAGSTDFPTTVGADHRADKSKRSGFITRVSPDGRRFVFSALLPEANLLMPTLDAAGNIYIVGSTASRSFPVTPDAVQRTYGGGPEDGVFAILSPDASRILYATYVGGSAGEVIRGIALGDAGEVYLVGSTASDDFPATEEALHPKYGGKGDACLIKLVPAR